MAEEKPLPPSEQKLRKERKKGNVLKAPSLAQAIGFIGFSLVIWPLSSWSWNSFRILLDCGGYTDSEAVLDCARFAMFSFARIALAMTAAVVSCALATSLLLTKANFSLDPLRFKLENLKPSFKPFVEGVKRLPYDFFSFFFCIISFGLVGYFLFFEAGTVLSLPISASRSLSYFVQTAGFMLLAAMLSNLVWGGTELFRTLRERKKKLSMSHQEVKQETKDDSGDPLIRAMRKAEHQLLSTSELENRVKNAKVIIVSTAPEAAG